MGNDTTTYSEIYFLDSLHGFVTAYNRNLYASNDGGLTWNTVPALKSSFYFENFSFLNTQQGFCIGYGELAITMNGGQTWATKSLPLPLGTPATQNQLVWFSIQFPSISIGYLTTSTGVYKTSDTGTSWKVVYPKTTNGLYFTDEYSGVIHANKDSLYRTTDGGDHWQPFSILPLNNSNGTAYNVFQFTDDQHAWFMNSQVLLGSNDGGKSWTQLNLSPYAGFTDFKMINNETGYLLTNQQIIKTTDGGKSWHQEYQISTGTFVALFFLDEKHVWAAGTNGIMLKYHP